VGFIDGFSLGRNPFNWAKIMIPRPSRLASNSWIVGQIITFVFEPVLSDETWTGNPGAAKFGTVGSVTSFRLALAGFKDACLAGGLAGTFAMLEIPRDHPW
jgi:hypothetical protein